MALFDCFKKKNQDPTRQPIPEPTKVIPSRPEPGETAYVILRGNERVSLPREGRFVCESHYATREESYGGLAFPTVSAEGMSYHLNSSKELIRQNYPWIGSVPEYSNSWEKCWTPANDGGSNKYGQAARGDLKPTRLEEIWQGNMLFQYDKMPKPGTKFKLTNTANNRSCIIQMGYEIGPGDRSFLGGVTPEVHWFLKANNSTKLILDSCDQGEMLGPVLTREFNKVEIQQVSTLMNRLNEGTASKFYDTAKQEMGVREVDGEGNNPRILEYHQSTTLKATSDDVPWCSSFVNWVAKSRGVEGTNNASARSWENWGTKLDKPIKGCIAVFTRPPDPASGHVGFYDHEDASNVYVLGGNQDNSVCIKAYPKSRLIGYRI